MSNERYTIIVSGDRLVFTRDQIESDPGNYIATYFFGGFAEGSKGAKELVVEKDAQIFRLIQAHLRGYEILPLADAYIPRYMTKEVALVNLLREAQFYGLQILEEKIQIFQKEIFAANRPQSVIKRYKFAMVKNGDWVINDTTREGYQFILARATNCLDKEDTNLRVNKKLKCPGFIQVVSWKGSGDYYALLESEMEK